MRDIYMLRSKLKSLLLRYKVETYYDDYRINFPLLEIDLYMNFRKYWNVKFQAK